MIPTGLRPQIEAAEVDPRWGSGPLRIRPVPYIGPQTARRRRTQLRHQSPRQIEDLHLRLGRVDLQGDKAYLHPVVDSVAIGT